VDPVALSHHLAISGSHGGLPYGINDRGHQGLQHDEHLGANGTYIDNRARYLLAHLQRFAQRDPLGYVDGMTVFVYYAAIRGFVDPAGKEGGQTSVGASGVFFTLNGDISLDLNIAVDRTGGEPTGFIGLTVGAGPAVGTVDGGISGSALISSDLDSTNQLKGWGQAATVNFSVEPASVSYEYIQGGSGSASFRAHGASVGAAVGPPGIPWAGVRQTYTVPILDFLYSLQCVYKMQTTVIQKSRFMDIFSRPLPRPPGNSSPPNELEPIYFNLSGSGHAKVPITGEFNMGKLTFDGDPFEKVGYPIKQPSLILRAESDDEQYGEHIRLEAFLRW